MTVWNSGFFLYYNCPNNCCTERLSRRRLNNASAGKIEKKGRKKKKWNNCDISALSVASYAPFVHWILIKLWVTEFFFLQRVKRRIYVISVSLYVFSAGGVMVRYLLMLWKKNCGGRNVCDSFPEPSAKHGYTRQLSSFPSGLQRPHMQINLRSMFWHWYINTSML